MLADAAVAVEVCESFEGMVTEIHRGAAVVLMAEEALTSTRTQAMAALLAQQPAWSDVPVLIVARPGVDSTEVGEALRALGNVTLLERPLRRATLLSAVQSGMRARERQYQIRTHLVEQVRTTELLRQADRRKDEFLATLGHELRNPLAPLVTGLHVLKSSSGDERRVSHIATVMERQVSHLSRLVDDLLELSRITRGLIDVKREPMDLTAAVFSALDTTATSFEMHGLSVHVDVPPGSVPVEGDMMRLSQVFINLLNNAAKYSHAGGRVWLTLRTTARNVVVSVRDEGIGIPADRLESVFDMFTQVDRSSRRSQGGLGVGLTIVQTLVAQHHGAVEARSQGVNRGSEFIVTLPLASAAVHRPAEPTPAPAAVRCRVLVVDDNEDAADTLGAMLESFGATVKVTYDGRQALEQFAAFEPDVVLLDIGMPGMDGYEVARTIRALPSCTVSPTLVALTGWGTERDRQRSREAGINQHMVKPPDVAALRHLIADVQTAH
jgi:signal transduction histidine kinase